mmetsp:Transcript_38666/g.110298  ORF Transcript_38666/g.110298 Transcript_38666/m.110298 type:complete len:1371 (+) Transcript_38666:67-4179(+)
MVAERNVKLEAFKHAIEQSKIRRAEGFRERGEMSKKLSEQLEVMALSPEQKRQVTQKFHMQQDEYLRETRKQVTISDFTFLDVIGAGGFGIVRLCQKNDTGEVFAIKQMRKGDMVHRNHVRHIRAEKDALCNAQADWVIGLHYTFQDDTFLYMVMDYLPGGDLMTHLQRKDTFTEPETRFYIAELVEAVDYIHTKLHCIHRDIKPDNIVFDAKGHIHLVDFGLCKHNVPPERQAAGRAASPAACPRHPAREELHSVVGTPDYMAPEAFAEGPCGRECDWWSVGIIMFEMLFGGPPFSGADHEASVTAARVKSWRQYFRMPRDPQVGRDARRFEVTFGPGWQQVWKLMVEGLVEESLIGAHHAHGLCEAAGIALDGDELRTRREKKEQPIHLARFPTLAAERLAFFFRSLEWIERGARGTLFQSETDALTGERFDVGSVPSLTQIIPAYNEVVIPSEDFLRAGSETADAMNQSPMGRRGVGDLTDPPRGDGVNTNLAFMISQFPDEWDFFAEQLCEQGRTDDPSGQSLYANFAKEKLRDELVVEVRFWACLRMQSVAKTVIGALQYERALASLPKIKDYYRAHPQKRVPEDHAELILAHQTYGMPAPKGNPENDESVRLLLSRFSKDPVYLVFDLTPESSREVWQLVETFLHRRSFYEPQAFRHASVKCRWDTSVRDLRVVDVLPRRFPLLLGQGNFRTQGKASNQLNGLRFAMGHNVQAMDCNMGVFIGEGFKVPYVLRLFMPLDKMDRVATRARYLGFREYIFTGREGTVGKCHAAAEWTFGTVYQRFLSGIGTRMHYGHPDFVDCFWARNRGGMSKSSPVVNLSEDIFAGYNVRSREEVLPHVDALEFEKGREATFNAASNFFSKISGGSVAVLRSRDNHLICEHIGILHSLSFYFTSVAFYVSNLLIDISIYLYVALFIVFTLANIDLGRLSALGSTFRTEWVLSMGIVSLFPQLFEMVLEFGSIHAIRDVVGGFCASTFFFIFQNKNIASAMKNGAATGIAKYLFTGRPMANQHQTWKDCYVTYWKSHYRPAISLLTAYLIYSVLVVQTFQGKLPMILVVISYIAWIITPIVFSPFPRLSLLEQDLREFNSFINGRAGMDPADLPEVIERGKTGRVRTLYECGLADEISVWCEQPLPVLLLYVVLRLAVCGFLALSLPSVILDFLWVFFIVLSLQWMLILGFVLTGLSNIFFLVSILLWLIVLPFGYWVHGDRAVGLVRVPEYVVSLAVFLFLLGLAKQLLLLACRAVCELRQRPCGWPQGRALRRLQRSVRMSHVFFFVHQQNVLLGYLVLVANLATSLFLVLLDLCNLHTWWLLNGEAAKAQRWQAKLQGPGPAEHEARSHGSSSPCSSGGEAPPPRGRAGSMV